MVTELKKKKKKKAVISLKTSMFSYRTKILIIIKTITY